MTPQIFRDLPICNVNHKISNGRDALVSLLPAKEGFIPYKIFPGAFCSKNYKDCNSTMEIPSLSMD